MNYYNDNDPRSAAWLRELIKQNVIPTGDVDERSIADVTKSDVTGYTQCHFFAGIGGWAEALRLAGVGPDVPLWTGSCPCQPFSCAGQGKGEKDERHLWPEFYRLIRECKPPIVFGEQVESAEVVGTKLEADFIIAVQRGDFARANKRAKQLVKSKSFHYHKRWLDGVRSDLETADYSFGFAILGAHSVNAPHIRQRLYWVADTQRNDYRSKIERGESQREDSERSASGTCRCSDACRLADSDNSGGNSQLQGLSQQESEFNRDSQSFGGMEYLEGDGRGSRRSESNGRSITGGCCESGMVNSDSSGLEQYGRPEPIQSEYPSAERRSELGGMVDANRIRRSQDGRDISKNIENNGTSRPFNSSEKFGFWSNSIWIPCADGKARRCPEPGVLSLVDGVSVDMDISGAESGFPLCEKIQNRVMLLRGYGNAINPYVAAEFIRAYLKVVLEIENR